MVYSKVEVEGVIMEMHPSDSDTEITLVVADDDTISEDPPMGHEIEISTFTSTETGDVFLKRPGGFMRTGATTPRPQYTVKPSLLRRSRGFANNPLLNQQFVVTETPVEVEDGSVGSVSVIESIESVESVEIKDDTETNFVSSSEEQEPEIIIWQPDPSDTCEIIEVQESELASFLQQKTEGDGEIQQIIVCGDGSTDGMDFAEMFQNYMVEVLPEEIQEAPVPVVKKKAKKKPRPPKKVVPPVVTTDGVAQEKKGKVISELKCQEPECNHYSNNVQEMRKHLQNEHSVPMDEENVHFATEEDFKNWRAAYERDRRVSFIYRGGTKKISPDRAVTYLICHRSGTYKPAMADSTPRLRKMKPQGSCKIGTYCTAGIKLLKQLNTGIVEATICHTHYGHELDNVQHLRISQAMKNILVQKFDEGLTFGQVLQYVHHNPDGLEGFKLIDRRAIRNVFDQWRKPSKKELISTDVDDDIPIVTITEEKGTEENNDQGNEMDTDAGLEKPDVEQKMDVDELEKTLNIVAGQVKVKEEQVGLDLGTLVLSAPESGSVESKTTATAKSPRTGSRNKKGAKALAVEIKQEKADEETVNGAGNGETGSTATTLPLSTEAPDVDSAMEKLLEHGESGAGPTVLLYKKSGEFEPHTGLSSRLLKIPDLCMVLQTPIQRQLLQQFGKVIHLELVEGQDMDVLAMVILDDFLMAIPVAWLVCNQVTEGMIKNFFQVIHTNCVEINCEYLFAAKKSDLPRIWCDYFEKKPRILYPQEDVLRELKTMLRKHFDDGEKRGNCYKMLETIVTTPDKAKFDDCCKALRSVTQNRDFERLFIQNWYGDRDKWAFHARSQVHHVMEDSFAKLRKFILFKGTKSLGRNIDSILKIGYDKCFQHNKNLFKGDIKVKTLVAQIDAKHEQYGQYDWSVERVGANKFKISLDAIIPDPTEVFDIFDLNTICTCRMCCEQCGVCIHRFWCSCGDQNLCIHSHALRLYLAIQAEPSEDEEVAYFLAEEENPFQDFEVEEQYRTKAAVLESTEKDVKPQIALSARKMKNTTRKSASAKRAEAAAAVVASPKESEPSKSTKEAKPSTSTKEPKPSPNKKEKEPKPAGNTKEPEPVPPPPEVATVNPVFQTGSRRSTRIQRTFPEDPLALPSVTASESSTIGSSRKRRSAPAQIEVVPIPIRKLRKVKAEPESEPETETESDTEPQPELEPKPVARGRGRPKKEPESEPEAETESDTEPQPELEPKPVARGRGRPKKVVNTTIESTSKATTSTPNVPPRRIRHSIPLLASFRKQRDDYDETDPNSLRSELLTLVNQIDRIKSARVLQDVKKRISDLSELVNKPRSK